MAHLSQDAAPTRSRVGAAGARPKPRRSPGAMAMQVVGELLMTVGVILLLFVGWDLWWTNIVSDTKQQQAVQELFQDFDPIPAPAAVPGSQGEKSADYGPPPRLQTPRPGETFAVVYVPRFGENYSRPVTAGVGDDVLDNLGLGYYPETATPGSVGNFAVAGHRQTRGQVLDAIHTLVPGDRIYVQTKQGYFTYVYRNNQLVLPNRVDVLAPVPTRPGEKPEERMLTMTSCNPRFGDEERIIAYSVLESWQPTSAGPPAAIERQVAANARKAG